jgi:hydroxymethylpyrimidine/phosphomethylpyrimidine kinase
MIDSRVKNVVDPVMTPTFGATLLATDAIDTLRRN